MKAQNHTMEEMTETTSCVDEEEEGEYAIQKG